MMAVVRKNYSHENLPPTSVGNQRPNAVVKFWSEFRYRGVLTMESGIGRATVWLNDSVRLTAQPTVAKT